MRNKEKGAGVILAIVVVLIIVVVGFLAFGSKNEEESVEQLPINEETLLEEEIITENEQTEVETDTDIEEFSGTEAAEDVADIEEGLGDFDLSDLDLDFEL